MNGKIQVHQIHFQPGQRAQLEPCFLPYDNSASPAPEQMEFWVFQDAFKRGVTERAEYTGFVSWKFRQKSKIRGTEFLDFIDANPGQDVYFINPFPAELAWKNVWIQGDHFHPGLLEFSQRIFDRLGYDIRLAELDNLSTTAAYCNYWVGSQQFWRTYMDFCLPVYQHLLEELSLSEEKFLWQRADRKIEASYFPFFFERMLSTLLATDSSVKALGYRYPETQLRSRHQPWIADMIAANYDLEDHDYQQANLRLRAALQALHAKTRAESSQLEQWLRAGLRRASTLLRFRT